MLQAARPALFVGLVLLATVVNGAQLEASVDRTTVRQNESFSYTLRLSGAAQGEPDFEAFNGCCEIRTRHQSTRVQILNGDFQRVNEWQLNLMARDIGPILIPPVRVGNLTSNPITMMVLAPTANGAAGDIFLEVLSEPQHPYVQAETVYTVRLFLGLDTRGQRLSEPVVTGGDAIVERLGEDRRFEVERNGRSYTVIERRYSVFPQQTGNLTIEPLTFDAQVVAGGTFSRIQRYQSDAIELMVKPAQPPPASHSSAVWLPARRLTLQDEWTSNASSAGIPVTRQLIIRADGLLNTQVPALVLEDIDGVRQYSDQPELSNWVTDEGIQGHRTETIAVIAGNAGEFSLPAIELPWFDVIQERWQIARVPAAGLKVAPPRDLQPTTTNLPGFAGEQSTAPVLTAPGAWRWLSLALAAGWFLTIAVWWLKRSRNRSAEVSVASNAGPSPRSQQRRLLRDLRRACEAGEAHKASDLLLKWAQLRFAVAPPRSLASLVPRIGSELGAAIGALEQHLYGPGGQDWHGEALLAALKYIDAVDQHQSADSSDDALLPLYR